MKLLLLLIMPVRAARITTGIALWWILTSHCSWQLELDESAAAAAASASGFGYELLIAQMELLEQKWVIIRVGGGRTDVNFGF